MLYSVEVGKNIVLFRKLARMTQEDLAGAAGISVSRLRDIEHGCANSSIDTLESIASVLSVPLPVLFLYSLGDTEILHMMHTVRDAMKTLETVTA